MITRSWLLVMWMISAGCSEEQFYLKIRSPADVEVTSRAEPVARALAKAQAKQADGVELDDVGVLLHGTVVFKYDRDDRWIASVHPLQVAIEAERVRIGYTLHPGHRDLPLELTTARANVCELRVRSRVDRTLGYAGLALGGVALIAAPMTGFAPDHATRAVTPYLAIAGGLLAVSGAIVLLVPAQPDHALLEQACSAR